MMPFFFQIISVILFAIYKRSNYICRNIILTLKLHERQEILSVGSRRTIVGGGSVKLD